MTRRARSRLVCPVLSVLMLACSTMVESDDRHHRATLVFEGASRVSARPPGAFISILDSVEARITDRAGNSVLARGGSRLSRYDSTADIDLDFPSGDISVSADVLSNGRVAVFSGTSPANVSADGDTVILRLSPVRPVLLVLPDSTRTNVVTSTSFTIYNAGLGPLSWTADTGATRCGCTVVPTGGSVAAGLTATFRVFVPANSATRLVSFTIRSAEGSVVPQWQYAASPITGVTVQPSAMLLTLRTTAAFAATVSPSGAPSTVLWTSSNVVAATVAGAGTVTGVARGIATVTATSTADTSKRGTADVRVYDSLATSTSWNMTAPTLLPSGAPNTVSRDDTTRTFEVRLTAQTSGANNPPSQFPNPYTVVEFWARPLAGGTWRRVGQTSAPTVTDSPNLVRTYTWSVVWNPNANDAPFASPSNTRMALLALGISAAGVPTATPLNAALTITVP